MSYDPYLAELAVLEAKRTHKVEIKPTPAQQAWLDLRFGMFVHFGINTFHDQEWSDGTLAPATFNPVAFNPDQWCAAAASAGMRYVLFVTKHVDGFCLWPSRWTDYSVRQSPFGRDALGEMVAAARRHGLKVGFYYCLWDCHYPGYANDDAYTIFVKRHLTELLCGYGEIIELWFDGAWKKGGPDWPDSRRWRWLELYEHVKAIQPECLVGVNGTSGRSGEIVMWPCDFRIGEKQPPRENDKKIYYCGGIGDYLPYEMCHVLSAGTGKGLFAHGKWFWHADDTQARPADEILRMLELCRERGANFVLNAAPTHEGLLRAVDVARLAEIGRNRT